MRNVLDDAGRYFSDAQVREEVDEFLVALAEDAGQLNLHAQSEFDAKRISPLSVHSSSTAQQQHRTAQQQRSSNARAVSFFPHPYLA